MVSVSYILHCIAVNLIFFPLDFYGEQCLEGNYYSNISAKMAIDNFGRHKSKISL